MTTTTLDSRIGTLIRNGETIYYTHLPLAGTDRAIIDAECIYVEHSDPREVAAYLAK